MSELDLRGLTDEQIMELAESIPPHVLEALTSTLGIDADGLPQTPLEQALELDHLYAPRPHLKYLSDRLAKAVRDVEAGQNRLLTVSMPPRMGKSILSSLYTPIWLQRTRPSWKIGMLSHDDTLVNSWASQARKIIEENPHLGIRMVRDHGASSRWTLAEGGGLVARSIGSSVTGLGFKVLILDDIVKDFVTAHSKRMRDLLWDKWRADIFTRLEPPYLVVAVGCLTAETRVLMADGSERPIAEVRPGDRVATYEGGELRESVVNNWANQGPDHVYAITMASGRVIRANGKHPFLTVRDGVETWQRTDSLVVGQRIRTAVPAASRTASSGQSPADYVDATTTGTGGTGGRTASRRPIGESGETLPAPSAMSQSARRASACPTTTRLAGQPGTGAEQQKRSVAPDFATDTASTPRTTTAYSQSRTVFAPSASGLLLPRTHVGRASSSSTTATTPALYAVCSATTATSSSATAPPSTDSSPLLSTYALADDTIVSIERDGYEDVFDIEVDRTHNFVANGLVTHNTRWHEDDFIGRLLSPDYEGDPDQWETITFPAIAVENDVLGREPGQPLYSPLKEETEEEALARWDEVKTSVGSYTWAALYQQTPAPAKGAIFDDEWWRYWTFDPNLAKDERVVLLDPKELARGWWLDSWDTSFKGNDSSDFVVGQRWVRFGPYRALMAQRRGRWSFTQALEEMEEWAKTDDEFASPFGQHVHLRLVEESANGPAILDVMKQKVSGMKSVKPRDSKEARARAITPEIESGHVLLPHPREAGWVPDLLSELRNFPHDINDDQVDALTQALLELRDVGRGGLTVPSRGTAPIVRRNIAQVARTDFRRGGATPNLGRRRA